MDIESHLRLMIAEDSSAVVSTSFAKVALDKFNELRTENARLHSAVDVLTEKVEGLSWSLKVKRRGIDEMQSIIDAANAQEPEDLSYLATALHDMVLNLPQGDYPSWDQIYDALNTHKFYASPIPAQQSPAVAVPALAAIASRFEFSVESKVFEQYAARGKMNMEQHPVHYIFTDDHTGTARDAWRAAMNYAVKSLAECSTLPPSPRITEQDAREIIINYTEFVTQSPLFENLEARFLSWMQHFGRALLAKLNNTENEQQLILGTTTELQKDSHEFLWGSTEHPVAAELVVYKDRQHLKVIFSGDYLGLYDKDNKRVAQYKLEH